ncbi:MAG: sigma-70 family RNA polymerase sigma factor [candidate division Zixibacteria bacterium]|nr:sigma-70 family RNA polymerase sigma factor [candidate division Zixibacteria bacterium]
MTKPNSKSQKMTIDAGRWLELYGDILFRYSFRYVKDKQTAEDLVSETLLAGLKAQSSFAGQSTEQTWLIGILNNKIMDYFRKSKREISFDEAAVISDKVDEDFIQTGFETGSWKPNRRPAEWMVDTDDPLELKEFWLYLNNCIESLDIRLSMVFVLRELEEMDSKNICNVLSISSTNLRVMLYRARKQLRLCLEKNWIKAMPDDKE